MSRKKECTETQATESFKKSFYKRFGYYPLIVLQNPSKKKSNQIMSLEELESYFISLIENKSECRGYSLKSKHRYREIVDYRFMFAHLARSMEYKLTAIARYLKKHHTSIMHYEQEFKNMMDTSEVFKTKYTELFEYIKNKSKKYDELSTMADTDEARD
jgi:hypothetical protein